MRKYNNKTKKTIIIILVLFALIIIIFSLFIKKSIEIDRTAYEILPGSILFDKDQNMITLNEEGKNKPVVLKNIKETTIYNEDESGNLSEIVIEGGYLDIGLMDTMKDLLVNFIGAVTFSIIGLLYIKDRDEYKIAEKFIPILRK